MKVCESANNELRETIQTKQTRVQKSKATTKQACKQINPKSGAHETDLPSSCATLGKRFLSQVMEKYSSTQPYS